ncbi:pilus assembly PilX N-terminal domain-containing protein [Marinilactibacillus psychrotolerans]|uniref:Pilus assembly PilX N-terminal domain-containing protein n=1 Tax=Marinilactibacillus psychrotolerans TaxID=191770 RepID=A0ABW8UFR6_9LACT
MGRIKSLVSKSQQEDGSGLVLTLMVLMVLSVLAVSLATVTIGSYRLTAKNRDSVSVYYVAEASLNETYEEIKSLVTDTYQLDVNQDTYFSMVENVMDETNGRTMNDFSPQFSEKPTATIEIQKISDGNPREYTLTSEGKIGNTTRTVTKNFTVGYKEKDSGGGLPTIPEGAAAVVKNQLDILGGTIKGDLYIDSTTPKSVNLDWGNYKSSSLMVKPGFDLNTMITYPNNNYKLNVEGPFPQEKNADFNWDQLENLISNFPQFESYPVPSDLTIYQDSNDPSSNKHQLIKDGSLYVNNWLIADYFEKLVLDHNVSFKDIIFSSNYTLNIDTNNKDIDISVENLDVSNGHLNILGNGKVTFHIKNKITFGSGSTLNVSGSTNQLELYYSGTSPVTLSGSQKINGSLFTLQSDLYFTGGAGVNGLIISGGKKITYDGGAYSNSYIFSPTADLILKGGTKINGAIVSKTLSMDGGVQLLTSPFNDSLGFKIEDEDNPNEQNIELIVSEPVIETSND